MHWEKEREREQNDIPVIINWLVTLSTLIDLQRKICLKIQSIPRIMLKVYTLLQSFIGTYIGNFFFCFDQGPFSSPKKVIFVCKSLLQPKIIRLVTFYSDQTRLNLWFLPAQDPVLKCSILECAMCIQSILQYTILILVSLGQSLWQPESSIHSGRGLLHCSRKI